MDYVISNVRAAVKLAKQAVAETGAPGIDRKKAYVAGDIGPIPADAGLTLNERVSQYKLLGEAMQDMGVDIIWFETFPEFNVLEPVVKQLKARKDTPVMVSFCVNQFGYSNCGFSARALLSQAAANSDVDCVGLNCGVGPVSHASAPEKTGYRLWKACIHNAECGISEVYTEQTCIQ